MEPIDNICVCNRMFWASFCGLGTLLTVVSAWMLSGPNYTILLLENGLHLAIPLFLFLINDFLIVLGIHKNDLNNSLLLKHFLIGSYKK